jgi:hypothetical protein
MLDNLGLLLLPQAAHLQIPENRRRADHNKLAD